MDDAFRPTKGTYEPISWEDTDARREALFQQTNRRFMDTFERLEVEREEKWERDTSSLEAYEKSVEPNRQRWVEFLTTWDEPRCDLQPRVEHMRDYDAFRLDRVWLRAREDIEMDCLLLTPHGAKNAPAVVCQHGLNGTPEQACGFVAGAPRESLYNACGIRLAEEGFVVIAPHEVGGFGNHEEGAAFIEGLPDVDRYRARNYLQRKASLLGINLLGMDLYHVSRAIDYLEMLDTVNPRRIGFYGLSQGGQSALWLPAADTRIKASVCAAYFNHRMPKYVKPGGDRYTAYIDTIEEDRFYWRQMLEFSDWQIVSLICPRAFMVEAGKQDGAAYWEMALDELNRAKKVYEALGIEDRIDICIHDGGHIFRCIETLDFLKTWV